MVKRIDPNQTFKFDHIVIIHFTLALCRFDRDWKKIEAFVGSKTVIQVMVKLDRKIQLLSYFSPFGSYHL